MFQIRVGFANCCFRPLLCGRMRQGELELCHRGWQCEVGPLNRRAKGDRKLLEIGMLQRSSAYLKSLLSEDSIFAKGCPYFHHGQCEAYYRCLLTLTDLSQFHEHPKIRKFT